MADDSNVPLSSDDRDRMFALLDLIVTRGEETRTELIAKIDGVATELRQSVDRLDGRNSRIETRVESIETQVKSLDAQAKSLDAQFKSLDLQVKSLDTQVKSLDTQVKSIDVRLDHHVREHDAAID